jgi:hypothetical protein
MEQNPEEEMLKLEELEGKWFIHFSNFPMWLKGDKTSPAFNYTIEKRGEAILLLDSQWAIVHFEKTLFTPEGYDVISRDRILNAVIEQEIKRRLTELGVHVELSTIKQA